VALSVEGFLKAVLESGLLSADQLRTVLRGITPEQLNDTHQVAELLIRTGQLTRFQARKLLKGVHKGLLLGSYQVLSGIGRGGMGSVFLARDSRNGQLCALKVLPPRRAREQPRLLARFQREMELSTRVNHPHIARTYEVDRCDGVYYIAMEFIPGQNLSKLVAEQGPLPVNRAARLLAEVAAGLDYAHKQGLIHRDLKPSNIMVTPHDHAKVLDLGLALIEGETIVDPQVVGGQGVIVGTMDFIAPEQTYDAGKVDGRSDIYSLGCTLYHVLSGSVPFPGGTSKEKIFRQRNEVPVPLLRRRPDLPEAFVALVDKMMVKDPAQRIPTAHDVEMMLLAWTRGEKALPLDRPEDPNYVAAVAALQSAEPATDFPWPTLDTVAESVPAAESGEYWRWWPLGPGPLLLLAGGGVLMMVVAVVVLIRMLLR